MLIKIVQQDWTGTFAEFARENEPFVASAQMARLERELSSSGASTLDAGMGAPFNFVRLFERS